MLLSRLANSCFWLGRYLERAADLSRALLAYEQIRLDIPGPKAPGWPRLAALAGIDPEAAVALAPDALVTRVMLDRGNPCSLLGALRCARENLRRARFLFPVDCWQTLNPLYLRLEALHAAATEPGSPERVTATPMVAPSPALEAVLAEVVRASQEFAGQIAAGMLRDEAHAFLRIGVHLERADMMFRVATVMTDALIPSHDGARFEDVRWMGLLKSVGAYHTYRRRYQTRSDFSSAIELLLFEPSFPRSVVHALLQIDRDLGGLPRGEAARAALQSCWPEQAAGTHDGLDRCAQEALQALARLHGAIEATYFSPPPAVTEARPPSRPVSSGPGATLAEYRDVYRPSVSQT